MAAKSSKVLLDQPSKPSFPESLLVGGKQPARVTRGRKPPAAAAASVIGGSEPKPKPLTAAIPRSQFLEKVKDFLGVMAEANEKLEHEVQSSSRADHDVEVVSGNEKEYIEMDLLLGVADLRTAEAVAAAEAAMCGFRPSATSSSSSSSSDTDDDSDEDEASRRSAERSKRPKIVVLDPSKD
ncbi:hypothetical protein C4D60_Mb06t24870 [Musa balbisiana]|uniref:Uncharacterized protein n=1 Tax=Musa balbisiana TaxID=52838 RepID=A0A4V4H453_MUSBA|nr:hypothetical protein C4D60_Mb06t24870 [Musa balbisiana]